MDDLFHIEQEFDDESGMIREAVARFVAERVMPTVVDAYRQGDFPTQWVKGVSDLGLLGMTLPERYGGLGASAMAYGLVCQELERGDSGLRSFVSVQSSLCMYPIYAFGNEAQKNHYLPKMASAEIIGCFGLTEAEAGSDPSSMRTTAIPVPGGYLIQGSKLWITNAPIAQIAIVWAKLAEGVAGFIVPCDAQGVSIHAIKDKLSLCASTTGEVVLEDVFVSEGQRLPQAKGLKAPLSCLSQARFGIAWGVIGAAMACYDIVLDYLKSRHQFGKPLASFQLIQAELVEMHAEITKARWLNLQLARLKQRDEITPPMISFAKRNACVHALNVARQARNLLGANGISLDYHVMRHMNNLESVFTYEGTHNVHTLVLGNHLTGGLNAFS